jgi:hypothetical protein
LWWGTGDMWIIWPARTELNLNVRLNLSERMSRSGYTYKVPSQDYRKIIPKKRKSSKPQGPTLPSISLRLLHIQVRSASPLQDMYLHHISLLQLRLILLLKTPLIRSLILNSRPILLSPFLSIRQLPQPYNHTYVLKPPTQLTSLSFSALRHFDLWRQKHIRCGSFYIVPF